jgi:DNA uptake protein ComE-like DNA-binding protein
MLSPFKNFFHYSKSERKGTLFLLLLLSSLIIIYSVINFWPVVKLEKHTSYTQEFQEFNEALTIATNESTIEADTLFLFNPNTIGEKEWQLLGFSEKQAQSIEKYKAKGATFKCKVDLKKLFVVDEEKYGELKPYIDLPDCQKNTSSYFEYKNNYTSTKPKDSACVVIFLTDSIKPIYKAFKGMKNIHYRKIEGVFTYYQTGFASVDEAKLMIDIVKFPRSKVETIKDCNKLYPVVVYADNNPTTTIVEEKIILEINTVDSIQLIKIKGIWPALASRILKKRNWLGGYLKLEQLKEVYGLTEEVFSKIVPQLTIDPNLVSKININKATVEQLKSHPYIDYKVANSIYWMRQNHGLFKKVDDIKKSDLINEELFSKIAPYLTIE